ncbi:MAG TPA: potassium channel family protein [Acidimicrobiales bacterium]|nr:potassium channel family protein [Acidimicrobiales bacterium]
MSSLAHPAALVGGLALVVFTLVDAIGTLVAARGLTSRWRPTRQFYWASWRLWRGIGRRLKGRRQESFLSAYAPLTLLALLGMWLVGLLVGWALVYLAGQDKLQGATGFASLLYYSGTCLFTLGFGDILAQSAPLRLAALAEAGTGVATMALAISYLPALYSSYGRRESRLLTLDDPSGERIQPTAIIAIWAPGGDVDRLYRFFGEWEAWTADILESHVSFPMLALFRSQHRGQSWITALGVVLDAAAMTCAVVPGAEVREPYFMYRRGRRALQEISARLPQNYLPEAPMERWQFDFAYERVKTVGLPVRDADEAWARLTEYRSTYGQTLQALIDYLLAPAGFWGHSAEDADDER